MQQKQKEVEPPYHHISILCSISTDVTVLLTDGYTDTSQGITLAIHTLNPLLVASRQNSSPEASSVITISLCEVLFDNLSR